MGVLEGKTVIVTGAGRGLGKCIALEAAAQGAKVVVNDLGVGVSDLDVEDLPVSPAEEVVQEIRAAGGQAVADTHSISDWDDAHRIIENALDSFGDLHGVVNNAGILKDRIFHKMSKDDFDTVIQVHLNGYFYVSRAAADHFRAQNGGAFVHMTSTSGLVGNIGQTNYSAAKMGIAGLSRSISIDMARYGVRSNCIAPWAFTRMTGSIPPDSPGYAERRARMDKLRADKVAPLAAALLSDQAAKINGQIMGARANELYLFNQPRPIRTQHTAEGWTSQAIVETAFPAMEADLTAPDTSTTYFSWEPV
ncbi:SDR family NAD(P)-dependent oxidoreductase [Rhodovibrionaceae bacterium A322]